MSKRALRTGFTTGTSAAACASACMICIKTQGTVDAVDVRLPRGDSIRISVESCEFGSQRARCSVIKDGGDDPDVTHGAQIITECEPADSPGTIEILGGDGVGTVTKPGLGLDVGAPAINPVPRKMITEAVRQHGADMLKSSGVRVTISVTDGKNIATKTDNVRLGILGGISILGTSGIVVPFSTAAYAASIRQSIEVAAAMKQDYVVLSTGGRSEAYARDVESSELPDHCYVQMGDFVGYAVRECAKSQISRAHVVGFIGKLAKIAAGVTQTHVKGSKVDTAFLADIARECGADERTVGEILTANTARHAGEIAAQGKVAGFSEGIARRAHEKMTAHCSSKVEIRVTLFGFDGKIAARFPTE